MYKSLSAVGIILIVILLSLTACESEPATAPTIPSTLVKEQAPPTPPPTEPSTKPAAKPSTRPSVKPSTEPSTEPEQIKPSDTTPPTAITGLVAADVYDGKVNIWWDKITAKDFNHYNIYTGETEIADVTGMTPAYKMGDITKTGYQMTGLKEGIEYYFAVTAVDNGGNENTSVASVSATSTPMPRGTVDPDFQIDIYESDRTWAGTTLLADNHNPERPRIIELNMLGEIIWEYLVPESMGSAGDVERLPNNNILFTVTRKGIYEINRSGEIVWSYLSDKISHDADRLPDGNTLFVWGHPDEVDNAQVKEITPEGEIVWSWYAKDHFYKEPYKDIYAAGWTHTNAVTRLPNGNTLISPSNFDFVVEVDPQGSVVSIIGEGLLHGPHDPEVQANGNILVCSFRPHRVVEIDPRTNKIVWQFSAGDEDSISEVRDVNRLPNGNILLCGLTKLGEITPGGDIVWQLTQLMHLDPERERGQGFYKAERIDAGR